jgi:hypothetical protein
LFNSHIVDWNNTGSIRDVNYWITREDGLDLIKLSSANKVGLTVVYPLPDINECTQYPTICGDRDCFNIQGSYECQEKCSSGFIRDDYGYCIGTMI